MFLFRLPGNRVRTRYRQRTRSDPRRFVQIDQAWILSDKYNGNCQEYWHKYPVSDKFQPGRTRLYLKDIELRNFR